MQSLPAGVGKETICSRRASAPVLRTARGVVRPKTLILAGNANEPQPHYGPPRVKEEELRAELGPLFEFEHLREIRFDTGSDDGKGALAWSALLRLKSKP